VGRNHSIRIIKDNTPPETTKGKREIAIIKTKAIIETKAKNLILREDSSISSKDIE
jgi:hypothetical protein